ncbi:hypothetical protein SH139x_005749 [Planctomycetaceae bacterium SH139]
MFDRSKINGKLESFDSAIPQRDRKTNQIQAGPTLLRKKPWERRVKFWFLNAVILPPLFVICMAIAARGLKDLLPVMEMRISRVPLPFLELLENYQGFSKLDLSHLSAGLLFISVSLCWKNFIHEAKGEGAVSQLQKSRPVAFYLYATIGSTVLVTDAIVFFVGLASQSNAWNETPFYVPIIGTALYIGGVAAYAAFVHDFEYSDRV